MIAVAPAAWRCAIATALFTGLRLGELLALTREDVDLPGRPLNVRATRRRSAAAPPASGARSRRAAPATGRFPSSRRSPSCSKRTSTSSPRTATCRTRGKPFPRFSPLKARSSNGAGPTQTNAIRLNADELRALRGSPWLAKILRSDDVRRTFHQSRRQRGSTDHACSRIHACDVPLCGRPRRCGKMAPARSGVGV